MPKALCILGSVIAGLLLLTFGLDLVLGIPFNGADRLMDVGMLIAAGLLGYVSWTTMREQG